ncbi:site-2 protease family protein [Rhodohalobacter sp. SW132]|uniref:site-2 protease family protein n=1 Tax=Rhodohalobacter sp. SW132 TaxID=2293433 RepID=UPI000E278717|nr:site-2 protease family protein [Rhodohalobacter sp. SW132]REL23976.1 site-2 protease family protein [Rhodohalobacter sp. SW132]
MSASLKIGYFAGIKVQIHWTFWLLFLFVGAMVYAADGTLSDLWWHFAFVIALFFCVILHEFGHSLTARKFGIETRSITLLPIGGVASLKSIPDNPIEEFYIALAGPLVNVVIAALLYFFVPVGDFLSTDPDMIEEQLSTIDASNFLFYLLFINVALVVFNMLPAFPMDGGRVFRALLSMRLGRVEATRIAAATGKFLALLFFLFGLFYSIILAVIAVFIYFGAHSENITVQQLGLLEGHNVRDAMITEFSILDPDARLQSAIDKILASTEQDFIVAADNDIKGILYMEDLAGALRKDDGEMRVSDVMDTNIRSLQPDEPLTNGYKKLQRGSKNFFPIIENGKIVGVLDMNNINEFLTFQAARDY